MSALFPVIARQDYNEPRLDWLIGEVQKNRFIPAPDPQSVFVGDGDFRAIGAEFLGHLVRLGGLRPQHRVLEVGSGIGRIAVPLTQYLLPSSIYVGSIRRARASTGASSTSRRCIRTFGSATSTLRMHSTIRSACCADHRSCCRSAMRASISPSWCRW